MVLPPSLASPAPAASCSPFLSCHPIHFPAGNRLREPVPTGASDPCLRTPRGFSAALSRVGSTEQALRVHLATKARVVQRRGSAVPAARHGARRAPASAVGTRLASFCSPGLPQTPATTTRPWDCALGVSFRAGRGLALPSGYSHHVSSLDPSFAFSGGELRAIEVAAQNPRLPPAHSMGPEACFSQTGPAALVGPQKLPGLAPGVGPVIKWAPDSRLERRETSCHLATLPYPASAGSRPCPAPVVSSPRPHGAARGRTGAGRGGCCGQGPFPRLAELGFEPRGSPNELHMQRMGRGWRGAQEGIGNMCFGGRRGRGERKGGKKGQRRQEEGKTLPTEVLGCHPPLPARLAARLPGPCRRPRASSLLGGGGWGAVEIFLEGPRFSFRRKSPKPWPCLAEAGSHWGQVRGQAGPRARGGPTAAAPAVGCSSEPARLPLPQPVLIPAFAHRLMGGQGGQACGLPTPTVRWGPCTGIQIGLAAGSLI